MYQNLTDTDSTSLFFNFICSLDCSVPESEAGKIIFECLKKSKILNRLDLSDEFWKQFEIYNANTKKVMGLYEIQNIDKTFVQSLSIQRNILKNVKKEKLTRNIRE